MKNVASPTSETWFSYLAKRLGGADCVPLGKVILACFVGYWLFHSLYHLDWQIDFPLIDYLKSKVLWPTLGGLRYLFSRPEFFISVLALFILEIFAPANPKQVVFSAGLAQDLIWFFITSTAQFTIVLGYLSVLVDLHQTYLPWLAFPARDLLPAPLFWLWWFVMMDLSAWISHYLMHHIPWLWRLHKVHHAQTELNQFTAGRAHVLEYLMDYSMRIIPLLIMGVNPREMAGYFIFHRILIHAQHANIRTHYGPLRFLLVTPQSHRVHHSTAPEHRDRNFGVVLSVWDYLFKTQVPESGVYPATGIEEAAFPKDAKGNSSRELLLAPLRQMLSAFSFKKERLA